MGLENYVYFIIKKENNNKKGHEKEKGVKKL